MNSRNGQLRPPCSVMLAAVLSLGALGVLSLVGLVLLHALGHGIEPFLAGLTGSVAGWLAGLITPRPWR